MGSVPKPRCARGQNCYHVRKLRSEQPPTVTHEGNLCEKCLETSERGTAVLEEQDRDKARDYQLLESKTSLDLIALKRELVLELHK